MGAVDCERQSLNVTRMRALGAEVVPVESGSKTLNDAVNEVVHSLYTSILPSKFQAYFEYFWLHACRLKAFPIQIWKWISSKQME